MGWLCLQSVKVGTWEDALQSAKRTESSPPPWHAGSIVKYIERERMEKEFGFLIRDPGTVVHTFVNEKFTNPYASHVFCSYA